MAKLGGGGRGKNVKAKQRRDKRNELAEQMANQNAENNKLQVTEFISVSELANLMDVSFAEVISKCMSLGIMVSINQRLDAEVIELVAGEFGYEVEFIGLDDVEEVEEEDEVDAEEDLEPRAPIVTIMGHVDHGKTSLLDYIRNANVVAGEAGGITQHIGAYQVTTANGKKITFLDTPGHEAFTAMRARGAKAADIAVIVIAADDAIMPQTREAISHSQAAGLPMVFAINKVDKDGANPEKIKEQLAGMNLLVEDWGGKYQSQEISAKSGLNIDVLLEKILLEAELLELKANPAREASGSIIEASLDKGRGYVASVLVQNGTLHQGDTIVSGAFFGKIKAMFNERGQRINEAGPSAPVQLLGLNGAPQAGEKFKMYDDEAEAKDVANRRAQIIREQGIRTKKHITLDEIGRRLALGNFKQLNIIIKGDFDGSVEALSDSLQKLSTEEIAIAVVHKAVGQITESDVLLATASDAIIVGFQVRPSSQAAKLAEKENIEIRTYSIIYDAIDELKSAMEGMLEPKIEKKVVANVEVRETYRFDKVTVAGCFVLDGKLTRNTRVNIIRDGIVVFTGELASLKRYKDDVKEVVSNMECGLSIRSYNDLKVGDIVEGFEEVEVKRTL
jgi:translation initiation factor IF-2